LANRLSLSRGQAWLASLAARTGLGAAVPFALANVVSALVTLAGVVLLTRLLAAAGYGVYASVLALVTLVQTSGFLWLQTSILRFHGRARSDSERARLATAIKAAFAASAAVTAVLWLAAIPFLEVSPALAASGLALLLLRGWIGLAQSWYRASGRPWRFLLVEAVQAVGSVLLAVGALALWPGHPFAAIAGAAAAALIACFFSTDLLRIPIRREALRPLLRELAAYGAPLTLASLAGSVLALSDRLLIAMLVSPTAAGVYAVAYAIAERPINLLLLPITLAAKPLVFATFEEEGEAAALRLLGRSAAWIMAIGFPAVTLLICAPAPIARLLIGGGMAADAARIIPWLAVGSLLACLTSLHFSLAFQLKRRTLWMLAAVGPAALLNVAANLILLPLYGMAAAAGTTIACYALSLLLAIAFGRRHLRIPFPRRSLVTSLGACVPLALFLQLDLGTGAMALAQIATGSALVYAAALALLHRLWPARS
jgi:O-antigen/teichoic acid export membrane protein